MSAPHPDEAWLRAVSRAIEAWLTTPASPTPTSQITGGGAVGATERLLEEETGVRQALLVPSASYGMRSVLAALGVGPGSEVLVPAVDWSSTWDAVVSLGAVPRPVPVNPGTLTLCPGAAAAARTAATAAAVLCHLHGVAGDACAVSAALPGLPVVEDCAQAFGSSLRAVPTGAAGTAATLSFGPGKVVDAGELGAVLCDDVALMRAVVAHAAHPVRRLLAGVEEAAPDAFSIRPDPLAAVVLHDVLTRCDRTAAVAHHRALADRLTGAGLAVIGDHPDRVNSAPAVPVRATRADLDRVTGVTVQPSGALVRGPSGWTPIEDVWLVRDETAGGA